jgi:hypothetical protein
MEQEKLSTNGKQLFRRIEFDANEQLVHEIRKHPFGLFVIYAIGILIAFAIFSVLIILPGFLSAESLGADINYNLIRQVLAIFGGIVAILILIITAINGYLYSSEVVIITTDKIAQVLRPSLFNDKISQLSIGDVQDVTVTKKGVLAAIFNYGTLVIETAGEQQNYDFRFTPDPYEAAKKIVWAHEENLKRYGN